MKKFTFGALTICAVLAFTGGLSAQSHKELLPPQSQLCYGLNVFCDEMFLQVNRETGLIEGFNNNCQLGTNFLVSGVLFSFPNEVNGEGEWVIFFDYNPATDHDFEYGVITGQGLKGILQRYWADGKPYDGDFTPVQLVPCVGQDRGLPTSRSN